jgi:hypothetical protein
VKQNEKNSVVVNDKKMFEREAAFGRSGPRDCPAATREAIHVRTAETEYLGFGPFDLQPCSLFTAAPYPTPPRSRCKSGAPPLEPVSNPW